MSVIDESGCTGFGIVERIQEPLVSSGLVSLRWSHERPKEPGFYWCRRDGIRARVIEVHYRIYDNGNELWATRSCTLSPVRVADMSIDGEWYGPIYEPTE